MEEEKTIIKTSQSKQVLNYLIQHRSITPEDALREYRIWRLAAIIRSLREKGYIITTTLEYKKKPNGSTSHWARYTLVGGVPND